MENYINFSKIYSISHGTNRARGLGLKLPPHRPHLHFDINKLRTLYIFKSCKTPNSLVEKFIYLKI